MRERVVPYLGTRRGRLAALRGIAAIAVMLGCAHSAAAKPGITGPFRYMQNQINALKQTVEQQAGELDATKQDLTEAQSEIDSLQDDLSDAKSEIDALKQTVQQQSTDMTALQQALTQAQSDIGTLQDSLTTALGQIGSLNTLVQNQQQDIEDVEAKNVAQDSAITAVDNKITKEVRAFVYSNRGLGGDFVVINPAPLDNPNSSVVLESTGVFLVTLKGPAGSFPNAADAVAVATPENDAGAAGSAGAARSATVALVTQASDTMQYRVRIHDANGNPVTSAFNLVLLTPQ
ncbi:MAG: hypothetical protein IT365_06150 [Candidatus Hydrogenedentes bacterium]|nr:hypothetical protein [Candidatus Hydrogenedentota bacterium]